MRTSAGTAPSPTAICWTCSPQAESAGSLTGAELQSLQALVTTGGAAAVNMSGSVQGLTYKVVDGDPANAQFLGAPLGQSRGGQLGHSVTRPGR